MTAIVGILNKQAVAVAADSAVTVGRGVKIYNTANKIFNLSKGCPVGIAIYGNAALNNCVPWEVVIKMYRKHIGNNKFPSLSCYVKDFFEYVKKFSDRYISSDDALNVLKGDIYRFWYEDLTRGLRERDDFDAPIAKFALKILKDRLKELATELKKQEALEEYKDLKESDFIAKISDVLDLMQKQIVQNGGNWENDFKASVQTILFKMFTSPIKNSNVSGVSIFGYGEDEIYPSLQEFWVYNIVLGVQRIENKTNNIIDESNGASICPMAQRDVIETFIEGVSHEIKDTLLVATESAIKETVIEVSNVIRPINEIPADNIMSIDYLTIIQKYRQAINDIIRRKQVDPLIRTIVSMGKEDIADLAENLIYMTSMKRHVTPFAETVGGPIDVAIISKGDGFIWKKRKHYFSAELNSDFFNTNR